MDEIKAHIKCCRDAIEGATSPDLEEGAKTPLKQIDSSVQTDLTKTFNEADTKDSD
jgi:hypothetical protein